MTALDALQETLAAEHAAVFVYGALGGRTSQAAAPALYAALRVGYDAHRSQRDQLASRVRDLGAEPAAAEPAYETPDDLTSAGAVAAATVTLEDGCASTYAALVAETVGDQRRWAIAALAGSAVRRVQLGAAPEAFPGAADLS